MERSESNGIWESYWSGGKDYAWWKCPAPEALEFIASQSPEERPNVLDLGCGLGRHAIADIDDDDIIGDTPTAAVNKPSVSKFARALNQAREWFRPMLRNRETVVESEA